jgi:hypothetical protein
LLRGSAKYWARRGRRWITRFCCLSMHLLISADAFYLTLAATWFAIGERLEWNNSTLLLLEAALDPLTQDQQLWVAGGAIAQMADGSVIDLQRLSELSSHP